MAEGPQDARAAAFETLTRDLIEPLRRYLIRRTDPDTADDVLGDVLLVAWRRFDDIPPDAPLPWAYAAARLCLANAERGRRRQERVAGKIGAVDPPGSVPGPEPRDPVLHEALALLSEDEAELLKLWAWEELPIAEIADLLQITPNATSSRLKRARSRLVEALRQIEGTAGHEGA